MDSAQLQLHPEPVGCQIDVVVCLFDLSALAGCWRVRVHFDKAPDEESPSLAEVVQRSPQRLWCISEHAQGPIARYAKEAALSSSLVTVVDHDPPYIPTALASSRVHRMPAEGRVL